MVPQINPENHEVVTRALKKVTKKQKNIDCFIYDRNCKYSKEGCKVEELSNIEYWPLTKLHAHKHNRKCPMSHLNSKKMKRRVAGINTMICEQTFAWFRKYP
jgi:hypothetical protein